MRAGRRPQGLLAALAWVVVAGCAGVVLSGCAGAQGVADTRRALERGGFREVDVSLRSGGGIAVARVEASPGGAPPADSAAGIVWSTLPVRFDHLVVALGERTASFDYQGLEDRLGPRDAALDRRQISEDVVENGLDLLLLLLLAGLLSVGGVVAGGLLLLRAARAGRAARAPQAGAAPSLPGAGSPAAGAGADGPDAIPS